jgi:outer membrane lipoprotein-sorting protein
MQVCALRGLHGLHWLPGLLLGLCFVVFPLVSDGRAADGNALHLQSIQADFIQEKHLKILVNPLVSTGTLTFQAPQSLRWEYHTPVPSILLLHGGRVQKFIARDGQLVEDKGMGLDSMQVVLEQISSWLDGRFTDNEMFRVSFADDRTVLLTPKQQALAGVISSIELRLADRKGLLDAVTIYEGPESYTRMTFSNRVLNKEIPATVFIVQ